MVVLSGACIEYHLFRLPGFEAEVCEIDEDSFLTAWDPGRQVFEGRAVAIWSLGNDPSLQNTRKIVAVGAPGRDDDDLVGTVRIHDASLATGAVPATTPGPLTKSFSGAHYQFGRALLTTDVKNCQIDVSTGTYVGCGQELLVGAPDRFTGSTGGRAFYYESSPGVNNDDYRLVSEIVDPWPSKPYDRFGTSFAAPQSPRRRLGPWNVAPDVAPWVAIAAPGRSAVVVFYDLDPTTADPFADAHSRGTVVELSPGTAFSPDFGYAMAAGDFDGDGVYDLAVGIPGPNPHDITVAGEAGHVLMYWGTGDTSSSIFPFEDPNYSPEHWVHATVDPIVEPSGWTHPDMTAARKCAGPTECATGAGTALAAGRLVYGDGRDLLVVGYPNLETYDGRVCQFAFSPAAPGAPRLADTALTRCLQTTLDASGDGFEFGYAVAVGDFNPVDTFGDLYSDEARQVEVAISSPGADRSTLIHQFGVVDVFPTNELGIDEWNTVGRDLEDDEGPVADGRFGEHMASGYVHQSPWEDLVIGAPKRNGNEGNATLTVAKSPVLCPGETEGKWLVLDSASVNRVVRTYNHVTNDQYVLFFDSGFTFELRENNGDPSAALCTSTLDPTFTGVVEMPGDSRQVLDARWPCGAPSRTWTGQDAKGIINQLLASLDRPDETLDAEVDVTMDNTGSSPQFEVTFSKFPAGTLGMDATCNLVPGPFTMFWPDNVCETP